MGAQWEEVCARWLKTPSQKPNGRNSSLQNYLKINLYCWGLPNYGILLWQPELTEAVRESGIHPADQGFFTGKYCCQGHFGNLREVFFFWLSQWLPGAIGIYWVGARGVRCFLLHGAFPCNEEIYQTFMQMKNMFIICGTRTNLHFTLKYLVFLCMLNLFRNITICKVRSIFKCVSKHYSEFQKIMLLQ